MKLRTVVAVAVVGIGAAVCIRLGVWQLSRLHEKQRLNASMRAALATPPRVIEDVGVPLTAIQDRRVELSGEYDERHQFLLTARTNEGSPGVHVVTPLRLDNGLVALVDRGWLYAGDAATALPQRYPEPGPQVVVGVAMPLETGGTRYPMRRVPIDTIEVWAARALDRDSVERVLPYAVAPWIVRQLPGPGVPAKPRRLPPKPYDEFMHISYAGQWFLFAAILLAGPALVARSRRRRARPGQTEAEPELYRSS